jgi:hypothetical protein
MNRTCSGIAGLFRIGLLTLAIGALALAGTLPRSTAAAEDSWVYEGTMTLTVGLVDRFGQSLGDETYTTDVEVIVGAPAEHGGLAETNPFSLVFQSTPLVNAAGEVGMFSSSIFDGVVFQYWAYDLVSETAFAGSLTDTHIAESLALNLIMVPIDMGPGLTTPLPQWMAVGTTIEGSFAADGSVSIQVAGNTTNAVHPFTISLDATLREGPSPSPVHTPEGDLTPTPSPTPSPTPVEGQELIANGGFEADSDWLGSGGVTFSSTDAYSGSRALRFAPGADNSAFQTIIMPQQLDSVLLSFAWKATEADPYTTLDPLDGDLLQAVLCPADDQLCRNDYGATDLLTTSSGEWQMAELVVKDANIQRLPGQSVNVAFFKTQDGLAPAATFYVDDVSLQVAADDIVEPTERVYLPLVQH